MHVIIWQSVTLKGFQGLVSSLFEKKAILKQFVRLVEKNVPKIFRSNSLYYCRRGSTTSSKIINYLPLPETKRHFI